MPSILYHIVEGFINYCLLKFGVDSPCGYWVMAKSRWYYCRRKAPWCVGVVCCQKSVDVEVPERAITSKLGKLTSAIVVSQNVAHRTTKSWCAEWRWSSAGTGGSFLPTMSGERLAGRLTHWRQSEVKKIQILFPAKSQVQVALHAAALSISTYLF